MKLKTLVAVAIAGAFALPLSASADGDRMILAQAGSPNAPGEPAIKKDSAGGTPMATTGVDRCKDLTGMERDNCVRDANRASSGATGATTSPASPDKTAPSSSTATSPDTSGKGKAQ